jgi:transcriptional regulator with XRE-family HTH domain
MTPGAKLAALRLSKRITQDELVNEINGRYGLHINRNQLAKWETDANQFGWEVAMAICRYFTCTLDELIFPSKRPGTLKKGKPAKKVSVPVL